MKVVLIYNPASGSEYTLRRIRPLFKRYDVVIDYHFTVKQLDSPKLASLIKRGVTLAVIGGDGTLNAVARRIVGTKSVLLPLPGGTFNHFVRDLKMAPTVEQVLRGLSKARVRTIDVGYVNDELFLNNSNLGLYPFSLIERKQTKKLVGKWLAAGLSAVDQLSVFRRHKLMVDGNSIRSPFIFVGNNTYDIESSLIPQRTGFSRGVLTVMIATSRSRTALIRAIFAVMRGDISHRDDFELRHPKQLTIDSRHKRFPVSFDGEVKHMAPPLNYSIRAKCLKVLVAKS